MAAEPTFPGLPRPECPQPGTDPSLASPRNLAAIQDREICCYSISCKEKDNIGAWVGGRRVRLSGHVSRWWLPEPVTPPRCRGPQQGGPPSSGVLGLCDLGQVATWALTSPPVTAGVAPALHLSTQTPLPAIWGRLGLDSSGAGRSLGIPGPRSLPWRFLALPRGPSPKGPVTFSLIPLDITLQWLIQHSKSRRS